MDLFSPRHLLIILVVVLLVFGTKKLRNIGSDLGAAVRGFKKGMSDGDQEEQVAQKQLPATDAPPHRAALPAMRNSTTRPRALARTIGAPESLASACLSLAYSGAPSCSILASRKSC